MENPLARAFLSQCKGLKEQAGVVIADLNTLDATYVRVENDFGSERKQNRLSAMIRDADVQAHSLMKSYEGARSLAKNLGLDLPEIQANKESRAFLRELIVAMDMGIGFVGEMNSALSPTEEDKLNHIRREMTEACKELDTNFEKNMLIAIQSAENGAFLGSALVASRVLAYVLQNIEGDDVNAKIAWLLAAGALEKGREDVKQAIVKTSKKSRDFLAHRIDTLADASDAMSLLGDCVTILKMYAKVPHS